MSPSCRQGGPEGGDGQQFLSSCSEVTVQVFFPQSPRTGYNRGGQRQNPGFAFWLIVVVVVGLVAHPV